MANSFKQMFKSAQIKRPDGRMMIRIDDIHIVDGFNPRDYNSAECKADDEDLFQHLKSGGSVPLLRSKLWIPVASGLSKVIADIARSCAVAKLVFLLIGSPSLSLRAAT